MKLLSQKPPRPDNWAPTRWSMVSALGRRDDPAWALTWKELVDGYRSPLEGYVRRVVGRARNRRCSDEEATDFVQAFLLDCVAKGWLARADPAKGRFRAYLQTLIRRHVGHVLRAERAGKRSPGPGRRMLSLSDADGVDAAAAPQETPEDLTAFDREWVGAALARARSRLAEANARYAAVIDDLIRTEGEGSTELAAQVGLRPAQMPVLRHRARERFARLFEDELRTTVSDEGDFAAEWHALAAYLP